MKQYYLTDPKIKIGEKKEKKTRNDFNSICMFSLKNRYGDQEIIK